MGGDRKAKTSEAERLPSPSIEGDEDLAQALATQEALHDAAKTLAAARIGELGSTPTTPGAIIEPAPVLVGPGGPGYVPGNPDAPGATTGGDVQTKLPPTKRKKKYKVHVREEPELPAKRTAPIRTAEKVDHAVFLHTSMERSDEEDEAEEEEIRSRRRNLAPLGHLRGVVGTR